MSAEHPAIIRNAQVADLEACPCMSAGDFRQTLCARVSAGARLSALFARRKAGESGGRLYAVLAMPGSNNLGLLCCDVGDSYPSITGDCPAAHWFEREIAERAGIRPEGHPWLKPVRFAGKDVGLTDFYRMDGNEVHEVAVGPVHAGVIEPGHFRFQCHGETVHHLEISLGYQHRGIEDALIGGPDARTIHYIEPLAGDTTIGHATAYAMAIEALGGSRPSARAHAIRAIAAELERLANHIGDLGALAGDVGFLPTMSYCGRIRGDVLNCTGVLCGNRFGRRLVVPGGIMHDLDERLCKDLLDRLESIERDATDAIELMFNAPSVLARFEGAGTVSHELANQLGLVGVAARASDIEYDVRREFPYGIYQFTQMPICTWSTGDCFARAYVRWLEAKQSFAFVREHLRSLPAGATRQGVGELAAGKIVVALVEGWRGEICHVVGTDQSGRFAFYKIIDPSFHNWFGLAMALREQQISDFPLCNKSFNLSYCGHDL